MLVVQVMREDVVSAGEEEKVAWPFPALVALRNAGERLLVDADHHLGRFDDREHSVPLLEVQALGIPEGRLWQEEATFLILLWQPLQKPKGNLD